jgi:hypothetical protein
MSINPETDLNLDELFQPAWAKESDSKNPYAKFEPRERSDRGEPRDGPRGGGFNRPRNENRGDRRSGGGHNRGRGRGRDVRGDDRSRSERRDPLPPPPEVNVSLHAEEHGAESLARQIKTTGRAYPLFDIARMILQKPDRYNVVFSTRKNADGMPLQPLFICALDDTVWLSSDEAVAHVLNDHLATFYQAERTEIEPPKGTYTFVAQCGMSGILLGPPNHHDYQNKLRSLHAKRFARMPFETYKARVKIVRDEAVVKQWVEEQSWRTEYVCLNVAEAIRLTNLVDVEKHFRQVHSTAIIRQVDSHSVSGQNCQKLRGGLYRIYRDQMDQQRRFPMQVATSLSQQFASRGLQFFKVNKTVTYVWVARPTFLDLESEPVSENVRRLVQFIDAHPRCSRRQLFDALVPAPAAASPSGVPTAAEPTVAQAGSPEAGSAKSVASDARAAAKPKMQAEPGPTPEQTAIIGDLHWLVHQGHVIEFANGTLETAKKPVPRPPQAAPKKKEPKPEAAAKLESPLEATEKTTAAEDLNRMTAQPEVAPENEDDAPSVESKETPPPGAESRDPSPRHP